MDGISKCEGLAIFNVHSKSFFEHNLEISIQEKHCIVMRSRFIDIKSLHVMYYRPFDRSMGL